jgi:hypothetical protein
MKVLKASRNLTIANKSKVTWLTKLRDKCLRVSQAVRIATICDVLHTFQQTQEARESQVM